MEAVLNPNYRSSKHGEKPHQLCVLAGSTRGLAALTDIKAFAESRAASTVRFIQIPFP